MFVCETIRSLPVQDASIKIVMMSVTIFVVHAFKLSLYKILIRLLLVNHGFAIHLFSLSKMLKITLADNEIQDQYPLTYSIYMRISKISMLRR